MEGDGHNIKEELSPDADFQSLNIPEKYLKYPGITPKLRVKILSKMKKLNEAKEKGETLSSEDKENSKPSSSEEEENGLTPQAENNMHGGDDDEEKENFNKPSTSYGYSESATEPINGTCFNSWSHLKYHISLLIESDSDSSDSGLDEFQLSSADDTLATDPLFLNGDRTLLRTFIYTCVEQIRNRSRRKRFLIPYNCSVCASKYVNYIPSSWQKKTNRNKKNGS